MQAAIVNRTYRLLAIVVAASAFVAGADLLWDRIQANPTVRLLRAYDSVPWIKFPEPTSLRIHHLGDYETSFEKRFAVDAPPQEAWLQIRALADARLYVNHTLVLDRAAEPDRWKQARTVDITPWLQTGDNVLRVEVYTQNGPRLLWAHCESLDLATGPSWRVSNDGAHWANAEDARHVEPSTLSKQFSSPAESFVGTLPILLPIFVMVFACQWLPAAHPVVVRLRPWLAASRVRWYVIAAWALLAANNITKIPIVTGFDIEGHINYVHFIVTKHRLPLADDGWQMFQTPLYYLVSAPVYWWLSKSMDLDQVIQWLRVIPLACGLAQTEVAYRVVRRVFPERNDLQIAGTVFAAFLPMNLYISQYIGNEPMAALLSALVCLQCVRMLTLKTPTPRQTLYLGLLLGLAILTKVTAVLLIPPCVGVLMYLSYNHPSQRARRLALNAFILSVTLCALCGWYFLRNYLHFGKPVVGGWEIARNIIWWQDPGYRTPHQFLTFGEALVRPISAGTQGMWDAFYSTFWLDGLLSSIVDYAYRPPWNYAYLITGVWLALIPTILMLLGVFRAATQLKSPLAPVWYFTIASCALYFAAFAYLYLTLPVYSTGKATYTLGLTPVYAFLMTSGLTFPRHPTWLRSAVIAAVACWAIAAFIAYSAT